MRGVVIHARGDLRVEAVAEQPLGPRDVRVRVAAGGICGSDLHYLHHGGPGAIRLREPMVLGHEIAGTVEAVGAEVTRAAVGARVAVDPSRACGVCDPCREGLRNHCRDMRFLGSAMRMPHVGGGFRETLVVDERQAVGIADGVSLAAAAMAEPLAVCLHAVSRAGSLVGRRVLVTGCGPIGALCVMAARHAGAGEVVATDVQPAPLAAARAAGADLALDMAAEPDGLAELAARTGPFDVLFEATGNAAALRAGLGALRPRGVAVLVGLGGDAALPLTLVVPREIDIRGTFRFDAEFALAVALMNRGRIDPTPLLTATLPFARAHEAFALAGDRTRAVKVQMSFV